MIARASRDDSDPMESHIITASNPLSPAVFQQLANVTALDEISNTPGAVRHHIYWFGHCNKTNNTLRHPMLFYIYQTTRHGPQNGFRLCLVYSGFHIASPTKPEGDAEDDIDRVEKVIPQGHMEVVILGPRPAAADHCGGDCATIHP